jgi:DAACS family dicarboxylate/amino acid:cation (Na+ or H+) symporter
MNAHLRLGIGIAAGAGLGLLCNTLPDNSAVDAVVQYVAQPVGRIFLRLLFMLVVPLMFSALVIGVSELPTARLGRIGGRTLAYTVMASMVSVLLGLTLVNVFKPGTGLSPELVHKLQASAKAPELPKTGSAVDLIVAMVPDNPVKAASQGDMLALMIFALIFGVALAHTRTEAADKFKGMVQGLYDVSMTLIEGVLKLAPIGIGALLFALFARLGLEIFVQLGAYVGVVLLGLGLHMFGFYSLTLRLGGGMGPLEFFRKSRLAMLTAFSTASSSATLPTALAVAETELKLPAHVSRFVLTAGSTMNQNGTALFEGVTVLFLAQLYGVQLDLASQTTVMVVAVLGGIGTAGVPAGSLPVIAMILGMVGVPAEGMGLILGVDRLLDMCRTTVNVTGDLAAAVYVARGETEPVQGASA